jgi:hypothetical protein
MGRKIFFTAEGVQNFQRRHLESRYAALAESLRFAIPDVRLYFFDVAKCSQKSPWV